MQPIKNINLHFCDEDTIKATQDELITKIALHNLTSNESYRLEFDLERKVTPLNFTNFAYYVYKNSYLYLKVTFLFAIPLLMIPTGVVLLYNMTYLPTSNPYELFRNILTLTLSSSIWAIREAFQTISQIKSIWNSSYEANFIIRQIPTKINTATTEEFIQDASSKDKISIADANSPRFIKIETDVFSLKSIFNKTFNYELNGGMIHHPSKDKYLSKNEQTQLLDQLKSLLLFSELDVLESFAAANYTTELMTINRMFALKAQCSREELQRLGEENLAYIKEQIHSLVHKNIVINHLSDKIDNRISLNTIVKINAEKNFRLSDILDRIYSDTIPTSWQSYVLKYPIKPPVIHQPKLEPVDPLLGITKAQLDRACTNSHQAKYLLSVILKINSSDDKTFQKEFNKKAAQFHPDRNYDKQATATVSFQLLQQLKATAFPKD